MILLSFIFFVMNEMQAQERVVTVDFESSSLVNSPKIPYDQAFLIQGEAETDIEYVKVNIYQPNKSSILHSFAWNKIENNTLGIFNIVVPPVLKSNGKYDFEITTYKILNRNQKDILLRNVEERIRFLLLNNIYFDGKNVVFNQPNDVYKKLEMMIIKSFAHHESKISISVKSPSNLVFEELKKQKNIKIGKFFKKKSSVEKDDIAKAMISDKVEHIIGLIRTELTPFINTQLVQHYRQVRIKKVITDEETFSLPVNFGMYGWNKSSTKNGVYQNNIDFTPGLGLTIPLNNKSRSFSKSHILDSFGWSLGVLFEPVLDVNGNESVTPGVGLPVYTGLGIRFLKVLRFNAGVIVLGEKQNITINKLTVLPTVGLALELNIWMGVKK